MIKAINWDLKIPYDLRIRNDDEIFETIEKFCGKNLLGLRILGQDIDFNLGRQFYVLEELALLDCNVVNFKPPPTLKKLYMQMYDGSVEWMSEIYANLTNIGFYYLGQLNDEIFIKFQELNGQLTLLAFGGNKNVTSAVLQGIANLTSLHFDFNFKRDNEKLQR